MVEQGLYQLIAADTGVQAVLGNPARLYPVVLPESPTYPCATYQAISDVPKYQLFGPEQLNTMRIQLDTWSGGPENASYLDAKGAQAAIRAVLDRYVGTLPDGTKVAGIFVINAHDEYGQDARAYRTITDFEVNYYPA